MASVRANWENARLRGEGRGQRAGAELLPKQPHTQCTLAAGKAPTRDCFCIQVRSQGAGKRGAGDPGKNLSLQCLLTGGCCPAGPCDLPLLQSNQREHLPSGSRNELLPLLPCWLHGKRQTISLRHHHVVSFALEALKLTHKIQTQLPTQTPIPPLPCLCCLSVCPNCCFLFQEVSVQW